MTQEITSVARIQMPAIRSEEQEITFEEAFGAVCLYQVYILKNRNTGNSDLEISRNLYKTALALVLSQSGYRSKVILSA